MSATTIRLWLIRETDLARLYSRCEPDPDVGVDMDYAIWVPKSIIEHTTKRGHEHEVTLPDWFIQKSEL